MSGSLWPKFKTEFSASFIHNPPGYFSKQQRWLDVAPPAKGLAGAAAVAAVGHSRPADHGGLFRVLWTRESLSLVGFRPFVNYRAVMRLRKCPESLHPTEGEQ